MRRLVFAISAFTLLAAGSAYAEESTVTNVDGVATNTVFVPTDNERVTYTNEVNAQSTAGTFSVGNPPTARVSDFDSFVNMTPSTITFESENSVEGLSIQTLSTSQVSFDFHNATGSNVIFDSTITPAGFGFYIADIGNGACLVDGCPAISPLSDITFADFTSGGANILAQVGFDFAITTSASDSPLYTLKGVLTLDDLGRMTYSIDTTGIAGLSSTLTGFGQDIGTGSASGYSWDATSIHMDLGSIADQTITYSTSVYSLSNANCIRQTTCLIAYSGFGDPIGLGGGISNLSALSSNLSFSLLSAPTTLAETGDGIDGLGFSPVTFNTPSFQNGRLSFELLDETNNAIPEPATWVSMILGFGLLGAAMRRRRVPAHA